MLLHKNGDAETAEEHYRQAVQFDPNHADALVALSRIARSQGNRDEANTFIRESSPG